MAKSPTGLEAERKCLVCDWAGLTQETDDTPEIGVPCPVCRAPTERVAVRRTWEEPPNPHGAALARLGASKGGHARASALSPQRRREIARAAAQARWKHR